MFQTSSSSSDDCIAGPQDLTAYKASVVRGYQVVLQRRGIYQDVLNLLSPRAKRLLSNPPPSSAWVLAEPAEEIGSAILKVAGVRGLQEVLRDASIEVQLPLLMTLLSGLLRLFGSTPHTLLSRLKDNIKLTNRGTVAEYTQTGPRSGRLRYRQPARKNIPMDMFYGVGGGIEVVYHLCNVKGTVSEPKIVDDGARNAADYELSWE